MTQGPRIPRSARQRAWRGATAVIVVASGLLCVASAQSSEGTDLRPGRYDDLATLTGKEAARAAALQARVADLQARVDQLAGQVDDDAVRRLQNQVDDLAPTAGLTAVSGPGVTVTLADAPEELAESTTGNKNDLVVHQQDIQAVVNAMWAGGARAVLIQGQRVVTTTGIKCEGSFVLLQGVPYPAPYVISAVGDVGSLTAALAADTYLQLYRQLSDDPAFDLGWTLDLEDRVDAPAYDGLLDVSYAEPMP